MCTIVYNHTRMANGCGTEVAGEVAIVSGVETAEKRAGMQQISRLRGAICANIASRY